MAIYHLSTKPISRSSGRSATASIAYRAGIAITDDRTGRHHDYTKRSGVLASHLFTPNGLQISREELWNLAETTETRKNSRTAREIVVNIPHELVQNKSATKLMTSFARHLTNTYGVAVDVAIHAPDEAGDNRNYHAHVMMTTRKLERLESGRIALTDKARMEMSNTQLKQAGLPSNREELIDLRQTWAELTNTQLAEHGIKARIDHRSHADRGLDIKPTIKMGWEATALERHGIRTARGDINRAIKADNQRIMGLKAEILLLQNQQQKINTATERTQKPVERPKKPKGREPQEKTLKPQEAANTAQNDTSNQSIEDKRNTIKRFISKIEAKALEIHQYKLQQMRESAKPLYAEIQKLRDNKPLNPFKTKAWQRDLDQKMAQYDKIKTEHDDMKKQGVSAADTNHAYQLAYQANPQTYNAIVALQQQLKEHERQQNQQDTQATQRVRVSRREDRDIER